MTEPPKTDAVTAAGHARLIEMICRSIPTDSYCMVIGGGLMIESRMRNVITTKDEDVVLLMVLGGAFQVASVSAIESVIRQLGSDSNVRKDQTSVNCHVETTEGTFFVEFVRGRRGGHGYFVSRAVLEATAALSRREGRKLTPPLEALAFLKAWAAVDKAKLVRSRRDPAGYHVAREHAFRGDVAAIRVQTLETRQPDLSVFERLFVVCSAARAKAIRAVLLECGWSL